MHWAELLLTLLQFDGAVVGDTLSMSMICHELVRSPLIGLSLRSLTSYFAAVGSSSMVSRCSGWPVTYATFIFSSKRC